MSALDIEDFRALIDEDVFPVQAGSINHAGESTTVVLLVLGPDGEEIAAVRDRLSAALLDYMEWKRL